MLLVTYQSRILPNIQAALQPSPIKMITFVHFRMISTFPANFRLPNDLGQATRMDKQDTILFSEFGVQAKYLPKQAYLIWNNGTAHHVTVRSGLWNITSKLSREYA